MKNRKPLLNPEAAAFVAGDAPAAAAPPAAPVAVEAEKRIRFTVDLPQSLHRRLKVAAMDRSQPMTDLARDALAEWLDSLNS